MNHPGVVSVLDDDIDETGAPYLVMELLDGVSVEALYELNRTAVPLRESLAIAIQLLDVIEAAHASSVVHRDIKPANVFLQTNGQIKVLDFGTGVLSAEPESPRGMASVCVSGTNTVANISKDYTLPATLGHTFEVSYWVMGTNTAPDAEAYGSAMSSRSSVNEARHWGTSGTTIRNTEFTAIPRDSRIPPPPISR